MLSSLFVSRGHLTVNPQVVVTLTPKNCDVCSNQPQILVAHRLLDLTTVDKMLHVLLVPHPDVGLSLSHDADVITLFSPWISSILRVHLIWIISVLDVL